MKAKYKFFKAEHPSNLISRCFMLESMRYIDVNILYERANPLQKSRMFYKYTDEESEVAIDINWEYCLFVSPITELAMYMEKFIDEAVEVNKMMEEDLTRMMKHKVDQEIKQSVDINIMDLAASKIRNSKNGFKPK